MKAALVLLALSVTGLMAQVGPLLPLQDAPQQTGQASIEGVVVDALTHEPIRKVSVMLNGRLGLTAVTDASGHFAFRQLPAGQYYVQAQSDRYPVGRLGPGLNRQTSVNVTAEEEKRDVTLSLTPGASVRGRILDEEGNPMSQCTISAMQKNTSDNGLGPMYASAGGTQSDENGEYRMANLPAGKYYLMANCPQSIPLPHPFVRRDSAANLPRLAYHNVFYPGTADPTGAARIEAQPGGLLVGIDFRMVPATGVTVRGRVRPSSLEGNLFAILQPSDPLRRQLGQQAGGVNPSTGELQFFNVQPGSYELVAWGTAEKQSYFAKFPVEVGTSAPDPIGLLLTPGAKITGTLVIEGDANQPPNPNPVHVMLNPAGNQMFGAPPQAEVKGDGTFVFDSVLPGRWRVQVDRLGYVKSVALGEKEVSGDEIDITAGGGPLNIVMGTKFAQLAVSVSPPPASTEPLSGVAWGVTPQSQQGFGFSPQNTAHLSLPPGQYHICACITAQQPMLFQNRALRKALESHCETVDIVEGGQQKVQISAISSEELKRVADSLDE